MKRIRLVIAGAAMALSMLTGGIVGATLFGASAASAAAATSTPSSSATTTATATAPSGTFTPNEDATHEAGESAAREAQENAGQVPTVP